MANEAMERAKAQLDELLEAAKTGAIIPVRLPGQVEAIQEAFAEAEKEAAEELSVVKQQAALGGGDAGEIMVENAEFLKTAIHELRTPMTSIRGYSDMMVNQEMSGDLTDMQQQLMHVIRNNSRRMESLISDMSYINKLRAGMLPVNKKMDMFKNIAQIAEKKSRPIAKELNRQLEFDVPQGLPLLTTDGDHFAHALYKLIENGLRYSPEGEGKVTVTGSADGDVLVVTISDNGIGMSEEEIARLGELYYRADSDVIRAHKGSGLGIPIAYGLLELVDAEVHVESTPDEGTTFTIKMAGMT
jgi:signal transduction histidine kinase